MSSPQRGTRPIRIANCSGAHSDPGIHMFTHAKYGNVDVITGDYLAEMNLAQAADAYAKGAHPGYEPSCLDGIKLSLETVNEKRIKIVVNGGALNPKGLAEKTLEMIKEKNLDLSVAYVSGDDVLAHVIDELSSGKTLQHLDAENNYLASKHVDFLKDPKGRIVTAHAYLGSRAIQRGLAKGADIIICGRVADASPVIGAAAWWHSWADTAYDELAGALIAGHLIECSTYVTGANFAGFTSYPMDDFLDIGLPIAEIESSGECVITMTRGEDKKLGGMVTEDTVKAQLLYELQGNVYLNSDVSADISNVLVQAEKGEKDRVRVSGVKGSPPPSTTKLAVFYRGGYQTEMLINATGYDTAKKYELAEAQHRHKLAQQGFLDQFELLDFQVIGTPEKNPRSQVASTTYLRIVGQSKTIEPCMALLHTWRYYAMQQFSGAHGNLDRRGWMPIPFLSFYPAIVPQAELNEKIHFLNHKDSSSPTEFAIDTPPRFAALEPRLSYEPRDPVSLTSLGPTTNVRLGDFALARSGDKGANSNIGIFIPSSSPSFMVPDSSDPQSLDLKFQYLSSLLTTERFSKFLGEDFDSNFKIERVEFPGIRAVHFVVYGLLGRGVTGSTRLDSLGKGVADWIRDREVEVPTKWVTQAKEKEGTRTESKI